MDASLHGAVLEIPPFNGWCSNVGPLPGLRTVSGG